MKDEFDTETLDMFDTRNLASSRQSKYLSGAIDVVFGKTQENKQVFIGHDFPATWQKVIGKVSYILPNLPSDFLVHGKQGLKYISGFGVVKITDSQGHLMCDENTTKLCKSMGLVYVK